MSDGVIVISAKKPISNLNLSEAHYPQLDPLDQETFWPYDEQLGYCRPSLPTEQEEC